jgi:very-short-patch-repair endonuclease
MLSVIACCSRWPGLERAREVVEFADMRAESALESIARVLFRDYGFPVPDLQVHLGGTVEPLARVDFYWRQFRTIAEVDGGLKYSDPERARAQLRRDSDLRAEGFEVVHFDWHDVTQAPARVAALTREAFRRGQAGQRNARMARSMGSAGLGRDR